MQILMIVVLVTLSVTTMSAQTVSFSGSTNPASALSVQGGTEMIPGSEKVSVTPTDVRGIKLIPYPSAEFSPFLSVSPSVPSALAAVLPYSIILTNNTGKPIFAYTVSWISHDQNGQPHSDYRTVCAAMTRNGVIASGQDSLVTIAGTISVPTLAVSQVLEDSTEEVGRFQNQTSIVISLEAVVFADGTSVGKDSSASLDQIKARIRSEYDVYSSVAMGATTGSDLLSWLSATSDRVKPGMNLKALGSDAYTQWYGFYQAKTAALLLQVAVRKSDHLAGAADARDYARSMLETRHYPPQIVKK